MVRRQVCRESIGMVCISCRLPRGRKQKCGGRVSWELGLFSYMDQAFLIAPPVLSLNGRPSCPYGIAERVEFVREWTLRVRTTTVVPLRSSHPAYSKLIGHQHRSCRSMFHVKQESPVLFHVKQDR